MRRGRVVPGQPFRCDHAPLLCLAHARHAHTVLPNIYGAAVKASLEETTTAVLTGT